MNTSSTQVVGTGDDSQTESQTKLTSFWENKISNINAIGPAHFKTQELPLARIKKIMKLDDDVKMISAEAPVLFSKAAEIFISELSLRAWLHTEDNKRRTLQRNDIAMAISKYDQFDFLIDIVPRDELKPAKRQETHQQAAMMPDQIQYYFQLAQNQLRQQNTQPQQTQTIQVANVSQGQHFISIPSGVQSAATQQLQQMVNTQAQQQAGGDGQTTQLVQADGTQLIQTVDSQTAQLVQAGGQTGQLVQAGGQTAQLVQAGGQTIQLQDVSQNTQIVNTGDVQVFGGQQIQYLRQTANQQQGQQQFVTAEIAGSQQPVFQIQTQGGTTQQVFLQPTTTDNSGETQTVQVTQ